MQEKEITADDLARGIPESTLLQVIAKVQEAEAIYNQWAITLTNDDRKRLFGKGIKRAGFIHAAEQSAQANPSLRPPYLNITEFHNLVNDLDRKQHLYNNLMQFATKVSDGELTASDAAYHYALIYYNSVKEAAKNRVPGAETEYKMLKPYFEKSKSTTNEPTEKQLERDIHALEHGTKEGRIVIENINPTVTKGVHKVIDETFSGKVQEKETIDQTDKL